MLPAYSLSRVSYGNSSTFYIILSKHDSIRFDFCHYLWSLGVNLFPRLMYMENCVSYVSRGIGRVIIWVGTPDY